MPMAAKLNCPHCGASLRKDWKSCWLCGLQLPEGATAVPAPAVKGPPAASAATIDDDDGITRIIIRVVGGMIALVLALIFAGLMVDGQYGGAIALIILLLPAGLVTLTKALKRQSEGDAMTATEKAGTFLLSLAVTVGAIVALGVAACVALFIACLAILSSGGMDFR